MPEIILWIDARYQLSVTEFWFVTAKKNVHFRPEIIHFSGGYGRLLLCTFLLLRHSWMEKGGDEYAENVKT